MDDNMIDMRRKLPAGCDIRRIRRGKGDRNIYIYADLYFGSELLISGMLDYIYDRLNSAKLVEDNSWRS